MAVHRAKRDRPLCTEANGPRVWHTSCGAFGLKGPHAARKEGHERRRSRNSDELPNSNSNE